MDVVLLQEWRARKEKRKESDRRMVQHKYLVWALFLLVRDVSPMRPLLPPPPLFAESERGIDKADRGERENGRKKGERKESNK